jgi:hypothetical protein
MVGKTQLYWIPSCLRNQVSSRVDCSDCLQMFSPYATTFTFIFCWYCVPTVCVHVVELSALAQNFSIQDFTSGHRGRRRDYTQKISTLLPSSVMHWTDVWWSTFATTASLPAFSLMIHWLQTQQNLFFNINPQLWWQQQMNGHYSTKKPYRFCTLTYTPYSVHQWKLFPNSIFLIILEVKVTYCVHTISLQRYVTHKNLIYLYLYNLLVIVLVKILQIISNSFWEERFIHNICTASKSLAVVAYGVLLSLECIKFWLCA